MAVPIRDEKSKTCPEKIQVIACLVNRKGDTADADASAQFHDGDVQIVRECFRLDSGYYITVSSGYSGLPT